MDTPEFEPINVVDCEGRERTLLVRSVATDVIGGGTRATIKRVLVRREPDEEPHPMALKIYKPVQRYGAELAMRGYDLLRQNMPVAERSHLPQEYYCDRGGNRILMPILNEKHFVISMFGNASRDRTSLEADPLECIPNFHDAVRRIMDAVQEVGGRAISLHPDVILLTIDKETSQLDYLFGDFEDVKRGNSRQPHDQRSHNVFAAGQQLTPFLQRCVRHPDAYLYRVHQEMRHRMGQFDVRLKIDTSAEVHTGDHDGLMTSELMPPSPPLFRKILLETQWLVELLRRSAKEAWNEKLIE